MVYCAAPWLLGFAGGVQYESAPSYNINNFGGVEYPWAGPRAYNMDDVFYKRYHRVWKLDRALIQGHIANWSSTGYIIPEDIRDWPGNGDPVNGEPTRLAPFDDLNSNDLYEPHLGEYPVIKGTQAAYSIQHTSHDPYYSNVIQPQLPFDLHIMAYSYEGGGAALDHAIFVNYKYVNRSAQTFDTLRFGQFADFAVGCERDDLIGCDSTRSLFFAYNGTDYDSTCQGLQGYLDQPPAIGSLFLNRTMRSHSAAYYWPIVGLPNMKDVMNGTQQGTPFQNLGYPTHFQYPGGGWMDAVNPEITNRKSVAATGPFTLGPGDTLCIDLAFIYARTPSGGAYASVGALKLRSDSVLAFYNAQNIDCGAYPVMTGMHGHAPQASLRAFPNPATQTLTVQGDGPLGVVLVLDMQGRIVLRERTAQSRIALNAAAWAPGAYAVRAGNAVVRVMKE